MSLKRNIVASYVSQAYVTLIGIITLPLYIKYMGTEAFGLVGFFAMLQASFSLLDLGLTPTISRETARFRAGAHDVLTYRRLFRALSVIFITIAIVGGGSLFLLSGLISEHWLKVKNISGAEVHFALQVMAISVALRWMTGLYRGVVSGSERLVWLGGFNAFIATLRFLGVLPVLWWFGATPSTFFTYQFFVALTEYTGLWLRSKQLLPILSGNQRATLGWSFKPVKSILGFSLSIALTSGIWVVVTQTDKLIMSGMLTLEEYGYFTLAVLVASGIMMVSSPISGAIMPRLVKLDAEGKQEELIQVYRNATQLVTVIAGSVSIVLSAFAEPILYLWTGNKQIAQTAAPVMALYAIGYSFLAVAAFPYYLQYAKGNLKLHIIGSFLYIAILLPVLFLATKQYGMIGAAYAWLFINLLHFTSWTYIVHNKYLQGIHRQWLFRDVMSPLILPICIYLVVNNIMYSNQRTLLFSEIFFVGILIFLTALYSSSYFRRELGKKYQRVKR